MSKTPARRKPSKVRKPSNLRWLYPTQFKKDGYNQAYECAIPNEPKATVMQTWAMGPIEARRLARWLIRFASWSDSRAKKGGAG